MVNHTGNMRKEVRSEMRGGSGDIALVHLLEKGDMMGKARLTARLSIPAGGSIGEHSHGPDAEIYIITAGVATVTDNGVQHTLNAGDVMFTGGGDKHSIANAGADDLELIAIVME